MRVGPAYCDPVAGMWLRCLIVDDNPRFGEEARSLLEHEGVSVVGVAASGDEAVRLAEALGPDLALVDISLGEESGFDVARRLVDNSNGDPPAIIFVSTYDQREFTGRIAASAALGFIAKAELSAERIRAMVEPS
jgi:two-component system, NarL family, nitrate/nitrite response regulator NarL